MEQLIIKKNYKKGFSLVEILVSISILLIFLTSISDALFNIRKQLINSNNKERAVSLAEEGLEISRKLRDQNFNFLDLPNGTFGIETNTGEIVLSANPDITDIFTRSINISTINNNQKKIESTVSWQDQLSPVNTVTLKTYLTNWQAPLSIGLTIEKVVFGGPNIALDFLPYNLNTNILDNTEDPPVLINVDIPIVFAPSVMSNLGPNTYTFLTSSPPDYTLSLSSSCVGNTITLSDGDAKSCTITYTYNNVIPTVTSPTSSSITTTGATLGANVESLGIPASISERGVCYGTTPNPTTNCTPEGGTTLGIFTQIITGLNPATLYYYRGYAINATGTAYSADGTFTTNSICQASLVGTPTIYNSPGTGSTSGTVNKPTGVTEGDIMFAHILHFNATDRLNTIPSGWLPIGGTGRHKNGSYNQALYYKVAGNGEGATYTFGLSAISKFAITISAYRGCFNTTNPIQAYSNTEYVVSNTTYRAASMNLTNSYTNVLMFPSVYSTSIRTFAPPTTQGGGWTEDYDHGNTNPDFSRAGYRKVINSSGLTGVIDSIGLSGTTIKHAFGVALNPL